MRGSNDVLTPEATSLAANVAYENALYSKRHSYLKSVIVPNDPNKPESDLISLDSLDSDSDAESEVLFNNDIDIDAKSNSSSSDDDDESDFEEKKADRLRTLFDEEGQLSRLLRAVSECDFGPKITDWENYIIEFSKSEEIADGRVIEIFIYSYIDITYTYTFTY